MLGMLLGTLLGNNVGKLLGIKLGDAVGMIVGNWLGEPLGNKVGKAVGTRLGNSLGCDLGTVLGAALGVTDGDEQLGKLRVAVNVFPVWSISKSSCRSLDNECSFTATVPVYPLSSKLGENSILLPQMREKVLAE
mmetsp:Transcript_10995/g.13913  ORF Transcript_10995/g.13913 Transcript_10995/m.13913 type:complete len:135 (+) Transcript_10995:1711-2115(+)